MYPLLKKNLPKNLKLLPISSPEVGLLNEETKRVNVDHVATLRNARGRKTPRSISC